MLEIRNVMRNYKGGAAVLRRWMVGKAANRAAVHGSKLPVPNAIPVKEVEMEIHGSIADKERKRREIEDTVDSKLKNWPLLYFQQVKDVSTIKNV